MMSNMEKDIKSSKISPSTKENTLMANQKEQDGISGSMDSFIRDNGWPESDTAQACGTEPRETAMSESGSVEKPMAMEFTSGSTRTDTRDSSNKV